jgi:transposase
LGVVYTDEQFAGLFPRRGQPALAPWRLALVSVLQFAEDLSDRQAADAVRGRIDWKYVLGLELTDSGFDASVLSEFRTRLVAGEAELVLLDALLDRCRSVGLVKARGRQRTDSTHVLAAIRVLNRLELVGETLRHALQQVARVAPTWLEGLGQQGGWFEPDWRRRYGRRFEEFRLPRAKAEREALAATIGRDGFRLLRAIDEGAGPPGLADLPAVETLRRVWLQQYDAPAPDDITRWRTTDNLPPAGRLINSPYDVEARYGIKRGVPWTGYKDHLTETCDPDGPDLLTHVATTPATVADIHLTEPIHSALAGKQLLPDHHLVDTGYVDAATLVVSREAHGVTVVGPVPGDNSWQARAGRGFDLTGFAIDWAAQVATCPLGITSASWSPTRDVAGHPRIAIRFPKAACRACPERAACTSSATDPRGLMVHPPAQHAALLAARRDQQTPAFKLRYNARAGIEGTLSEAVRVADLRHARYLGLAKTRLQAALTAAALNIHRLASWWNLRPRAPTRRSPFTSLAIAS